MLSSNSAPFFNATMVTWSPDGRHIYYVKRQTGSADGEVFRVAATGGPEEGTGLRGVDIRNLDIAPDGSRIAFAIGAVNRPEIWAIENIAPKR